MNAPFFIELSAGSQIRIKRTNVAITEFVLHAGILLPGLRPACRPANGEEHRDVSHRQRGTRQNVAKPMRDESPPGRQGGNLRALDPLPDRLLETRRKRGVRTPFLENLAE